MRGLLSDRFLKRILGNRKRQDKHSDAAMDERSRVIDGEAGTFSQPIEGELAVPKEEAADDSSSVAPGQAADYSKDEQAENAGRVSGK